MKKSRSSNQSLGVDAWVRFAQGRPECGWRGSDNTFQWGTSYLLEWMLSVDNLFVFHPVFRIFKTPDDQKHKPPYWGIIGAIVFRMAFFCNEEMLMHM